MIDLYYWPTPNGHKITLLLEETGLPYALHPVDIGKGAQFEPAFLAISPNNKMPAIVDHAPADGGEPISVFESGAILRYLSDKAGRFTGVAAGADARPATQRAYALARQVNPNAGKPQSDEEKQVLFGQSLPRT